jgi:hypothetical protein
MHNRGGATPCKSIQLLGSIDGAVSSIEALGI